VFLVALRTVPEDSTGVAHILEHTALCGSEHYPVRDPFFMMLRRSLNTFMNAFTSSDWTAYPFASQNRKDFRNLLDVYLDAVFFSDSIRWTSPRRATGWSSPSRATRTANWSTRAWCSMR
jgi:Zn-dependent M16 (insulinase) family peptidase